MRILSILFLTVLLSLVAAEDSSLQLSVPGTSKESVRVIKSTKAYRKAKEECLKKSDVLKGKNLTDCIVNYQKK